MEYQTVFFDFDGVLSRGLLYSGLKKDYPLAFNFIEEYIFGAAAGIADKWMRGQLNYEQVNKLIAEGAGLTQQKVSDYLEDSVRRLTIEKRLLDWAETFQKNGLSVALVTNNMDIFNQVAVAHYGLDKFFPVIVNSCDYGLLKHEQDGRLFDIALQRLGCHSFEDSLLIDDSAKARQVFENKGGLAFAFTTYENFEPWAQENLVG